MKALLLDTSSDQIFLALSEQGQLLHFLTLPATQISSSLALHLHTFLHTHATSLENIDYIAIGVGPGSFLGTRIGVTLGKALSYGCDIPLISFCSLTAYAPPTYGAFAVLADAKSKGCYLLKGWKTKDATTYETSPSLYSLEDLAHLHAQEKLFLITPHHSSWSHKLSFLNASPLEVSPSLDSLCRRCYQDISLSPSYPLDPTPIHYLRLS